jgi:2-oxoglutarate dehydrogenase E1 component
MLRHPSAVSDVSEFEESSFLKIITESNLEQANRILVCSGKIGHELRKERDARKNSEISIVFLEQFYPFPENELRDAFTRCQKDAEIIWVQEEPANMGGLNFVLPYLQRLVGSRAIRTVKRSATGTPATGSAKAHQVEQKTLLALAFAKI